MRASQARDPGSNPGSRIAFLFLQRCGLEDDGIFG